MIINGSSMLLAALAMSLAAPAAAETTLRVVAHSDLKILDPIWTTAFIVRNHGYMIYDTLFALDDKLLIKPQMVERWTVSRRQAGLDLYLARRARFFRRRAGHVRGRAGLIEALVGARCARADPVDQGRRRPKAVDAKTFRLVLKEKTGIVLQALSKPSGPRSSCQSAWPRRTRSSRSRTTLARARSSSSATSGSRATRRSTSRTPNTSRAANRRAASRVARSPRSTASNGWRCPTSRRR